MDEEVLTGGHVNTVVRVGDTVRRPAGAWTPTVHRLLRHARERGVTWAPVPYGYDEVGREVVSFISGDVPHEMAEWVWSSVVLTDVARALRQWHDATSQFDRGGAVWNLDAREPGEVICHNDFAPYNCVFRDGRFVGAIDFDLCSPGPRLWDIAYTAYRYVPLMPPTNADVADGDHRERSRFEVTEMCSRLDTFLAAYAAGSVAVRYSHAEVFGMAIERLFAIAAWTSNHVAKTGNTSLQKHAQMYRAHAQWIDDELCLSRSARARHYLSP
jgi:Ser/Thr protein kinase RdoA (MazF antagonist)